MTIKTKTISFEDFADPEFKAPSHYYFKNAMSQFVFILVKSRVNAQNYLNDEYGYGFYTVRSYGVEQQDREITARG